MAKVRVGVKRIKKGCEVQEIGDEADAEVFQLWVEINGRRFTTEELGLIEVTYGSRPITLASVGYVDLDGECVVFVFPEYPDEKGDPKRVHWGEAAEADLILQRIERFDPSRGHIIDAPN